MLMKLKKKYISFIFIFVIIFMTLGLYLLNQDTDNKFSKKIKDNTPVQIKTLLKNTLFYLPTKLRENKNLTKKNEKLKQQNKKLYLENLSFKNQLNFGKINSYNLKSKNNYKIVEYTLPFFSQESLYENKRKGYLDISENYVFVFFGSGKSILINKNDLQNEKFTFKNLSNNLNNLNLFNQEIDWTGIKDIKIDDGKVYISITKEFEKNCYHTELYVSDISLEKLFFKNINTNQSKICAKISSFFESYPSFKNFNGYQTGGRIITDLEDIYLTVGDYNQWDKVQKLDNNFGKIIKINKNYNDKKIISLGHRNQQGIYLIDKNKIIATEHGPKGGDELNLINLNKLEIQNFGWPMSSYGDHYDSVPLSDSILKIAPLYKNHKNYGFIEPAFYFEKSIGISEIIKNFYSETNNYFVTSLKNKTIYEIEFDENFKNPKIIDEILVGERIRDIVFDQNTQKYYLYLENTPKLAILEKIN
jgi:hypothetical protein